MREKEDIKKERGITLVALVITIIIIIILASITMNMAFGDNGLIKQAQLAKDMAANSVIAEQEGMNSLMGEFANTMGNEIDNPTDPDPEEPDPEPEPGEEIPEGTITFGEVVWSGYRASVSVNSSALNASGTSASEESSTETKYTIQYQVNGTTENRWYTINSGESVENLYHGDKVYARLTDGEKASKAQEKQVLDTKTPAKATIKLNKENLTAGDTLTAKVTHIDNESGVDLAQSKWIMNQTASEIGIEAGSYTGTFSSNGETITLNSSTTGEYYLHILTVDKGGNKTETISNKITIGNITGTVQQKGVTTWSSGKASIELETTESQYTIEYKINSGGYQNYSGAITNLNYGDKVTARLTNGTATGPETTIEIKDENDPVVIVTAGGTTTNSVTVSVSASDNESGMAENVTYTYYIKKTSEGDGSYSSPNGATNIAQTNYTFTNLDQGTSYDVKVEAKADKAGNIGTGNLLNQTTATIGGASEGLVEGNIVAGPVTWKNEKASTTLTTSTRLQIQYQINNTTEEKWQTISNGGTVGNLNHGDTVFARLYDGKNHGDYASVNILDGIAPTVQISVGEITSNSIQVSVTANDGQSGLATSNTYKYYLNNSLKKTTTETSYTFEGLKAKTSYEVKVEAYDKANNKGTDTENVETEGHAWDLNKVNPEISDDSITVPVPKGYTASDATGERSVNDGFVIYEGTEEVNDGNVDTAKTTRNQFVWIPVPDISQIANQTSGIDGNGRQNYQGKLYSFSSTGAKEMTSYGQGTTSYREPDIVTGNSSGTGTSYDGSSTYLSILRLSSSSEFKTQLQEEFNEMIESVDIYGGFYIGRYETGNLASNTNTKPVVVKGNEDISNVNWYYMYQNSKKVAANNNVVSTMIWGSMWDRALIWLTETGEKTYEEITNSTTWGNYSDSTGAAATNSGSRQPTGTNEAWKANNIYDLAGNVYDRTIEANNTSNRVYRGGGSIYSGSSFPSSYRNYNGPSATSSSYGTRLAFYVAL